MSQLSFLIYSTDHRVTVHGADRQVSLSNLAGIRNSLIKMLRTCYCTITIHSSIILCLFLDETEEGFGREQFHEELERISGIQVRLPSFPLFAFFNMETKHLWPGTNPYKPPLTRSSIWPLWNNSRVYWKQCRCKAKERIPSWIEAICYVLDMIFFRYLNQ